MKKKNSVLIVDDERGNISSLKSILGDEYTIYASTNGRDAIETAEEFIPDIILLDVLMPEMDGYDVIAAFKKSERTHDIPVIFITGLDGTNAEIKGLALGAVDYILKPFHPAIVKLRVQHQIQLVERLRQQTLMTKISCKFLTSPYSDALFTDTLRVIGEFMGIAVALLYKLERNNNVLVCQNEWLDSELNLSSRMGDKVELDEKMITAINNLLTGNEKDLCIHSNSPMIKDLLSVKRTHLENYIATPIFIKRKLFAILVFSRNDEAMWSESERDLAVLAASIFSGVFERDAIQHAEYLSRTKSEFLSRMSHEMRTPMNVIIGILQVFGMLGVPDNIKEHCSAMDEAAHTLLDLINDVLDISDMGYGTYKLSESAFDFNAMVCNVLRIADNNASKKKQMLDSKIDPAIPASLLGDENRLRQVISALLSNAVKFTPNGGEIYLNARVIDSNSEKITLQVEISDNGIGISKEQQKDIFSIFEQADGSLTREHGGIGLGLALSKRIVEMMEGKIWIESELGKGSKFIFNCRLKFDK